jgi:hypothetical protein
MYILYARYPVNPKPDSNVSRYAHRKKRNRFFGAGAGAESAYDRRKDCCNGCLKGVEGNLEASRMPGNCASDLRDNEDSCIVEAEAAFWRIRIDPTAIADLTPSLRKAQLSGEEIVVMVEGDEDVPDAGPLKKTLHVSIDARWIACARRSNHGKPMRGYSSGT